MQFHVRIQNTPQKLKVMQKLTRVEVLQASKVAAPSQRRLDILNYACTITKLRTVVSAGDHTNSTTPSSNTSASGEGKLNTPDLNLCRSVCTALKEVEAAPELLDEQTPMIQLKQGPAFESPLFLQDNREVFIANLRKDLAEQYSVPPEQIQIRQVLQGSMDVLFSLPSQMPGTEVIDHSTNGVKPTVNSTTKLVPPDVNKAKELFHNYTSPLVINMESGTDKTMLMNSFKRFLPILASLSNHVRDPAELWKFLYKEAYNFAITNSAVNNGGHIMQQNTLRFNTELSKGCPSAKRFLAALTKLNWDASNPQSIFNKGNTNTLMLFWLIKECDYYHMNHHYVVDNPPNGEMYCVPVLVATFDGAAPLPFYCGTPAAAAAAQAPAPAQRYLWEWKDDAAWRRGRTALGSL
ncbi:hypothetical protein Pelo_2095 [Pelomyxa schiedti]|nr:hypothetical protein Pelo_2095 [Pelomyxa schiedti]